MRKIAATYIFPCNRPPIKNGILICENDGSVLQIVDGQKEIKEEANLEFYSGILVPGFVNTHCHLELSHLKGKIPGKTGIGDFIGAINLLRNEDGGNIGPQLMKNDRLMFAAGTVAVGDISNADTTIETKKKSNIYYHTFVETFGFHPSRAEKAYEIASLVRNEFANNGLAASIVPHSPYSVSIPLFNKIFEKAKTEQSILSIHNQESRGETQFFKDGTGPIANHLQNNLGIDISHWKPTGKSSLSSILSFLPKENQLLLVHNTFTGEQDIETLKKQRSLKNTYWVVCPNSNLYIENQLPPIQLFQQKELNVCIGTDSLASNHQLSVLAELIAIQHHFPEIELSELFTWACLNGARALQIEKFYGSFETGKKPGVNLITGVDLKNMKLTEKSKVKRLV